MYVCMCVYVLCFQFGSDGSASFSAQRHVVTIVPKDPAKIILAWLVTA